MYARPTIKKKTTTLGVSGRLWRDALVMYDRESRSLWSQITGEAVAGPAKGAKLEEVPSRMTTWAEWRGRHPDTLVLEKPAILASAYDRYHQDSERIGVVGSENPDARLGPKALVFGVRTDGADVAIPIDALAGRGVTEMEPVDGFPIVIVSPPGESSVIGFRPQVSGRMLSFDGGAGDDFELRDRETGSVWSWENGECLSGPRAGSKLDLIDGLVAYWGVWARYHPDTLLMTEGLDAVE